MSKAESIWRDASITVPSKPRDWSYNHDHARLARAKQRETERKTARIALLRARLALLAAS
jgi:hypothetical protein